MQGWAKALQHQPTESGVYTAVSRESLVRERSKKQKQARKKWMIIEEEEKAVWM